MSSGCCPEIGVPVTLGSKSASTPLNPYLAMKSCLLALFMLMPASLVSALTEIALSTNLSSWTDLLTFDCDGSDCEMSDTLPTDDTFYRVVVNPPPEAAPRSRVRPVRQPWALLRFEKLRF